MKQPEGFVKPGKKDYICKLNKSLYSLKQAGKIWHHMVGEFMLEIGFKRIPADMCIFIREAFRKKTRVALYVDDFISSGDTRDLDLFEKQMASRFAVKLLGPAKFVVGIRITKNKDGISIDQQTYINQILEERGLLSCKAHSLPIAGGDKKALTSEELEQTTDTTEYKQIVGKLMYASTSTRPNIMFAVGYLARFAAHPTLHHIQIAKKLLRYLSGKSNIKINFPSSHLPIVLEGFADADYAESNDRRSTTSYIFTINQGAVSWKSRLQRSTALSSTKSEYMSYSDATTEAIYIRQLLSNMGHPQTSPTIIFVDNQSAIALAQNPIHHQRSKHIDVRYHFIREKIKEGQIELRYLPGNQQPADMLTKPVSCEIFERCGRIIGLWN